jgi:hypothetical protein
MNIELLTQKGSTIYYPSVESGISFDHERGQASKLAFSVTDDSKLSITEGSPVSFKVDDKGVFYGFVFSMQRDKKGVIKITCYDQMRYLKNKDTYVFKKKTAGAIVKMIAGDFGLKTGTIASTVYKISKVEDNQTLLDMINNALEETLREKTKMYTLYDDFGKLQLRDVENLKIPLIIDEETGENYDYTSSIDDGTYNKVKLSYENEEAGKRDIYIAQDSSHINAWGLLQYFETIKDKTGAKAKAKALLSLYNVKTRKLQIKNAFGDTRVRAGCAVVVKLDLGDVKLSNYMMVESAKHSFKENLHTMDLTLRGGEFLG